MATKFWNPLTIYETVQHPPKLLPDIIYSCLLPFWQQIKIRELQHDVQGHAIFEQYEWRPAVLS